MKGGCRCGQVRYEIDPPPVLAACCHCADCRRASGMPSTVWVETDPENFRLTKGSLEYVRSSANARRGYCPQCRTQIVFDYQKHGVRDFGVTQYTLDNPGRPPLSCHIWTDSASAPIDDGLPRHRRETPEFSALVREAERRATGER